MTTFPPAWDKDYAFFFHTKTALTNQNIFRTLKHIFRKSKYCSTKFLHVLKLTQFQKLKLFCQKLFCILRKTTIQRQGEYFYSIWFMGEIFPPHTCAHRPGEGLFEVVMCTVGAASQISCMVKGDICF